MRAFVAALLLAVSTVPPAVASAATASGTLSVTASVAANCVLATNADVDFGTYRTGAGGPVDVTVAAVSIACTKDAAAVSIALDRGEYAQGGHRAMGGGPGTATVAYDIYTDQERSTVWNTVNTVAYAARSSRAVNIPLYGRIPAGQSIAPGRYSDVLLAMVDF